MDAMKIKLVSSLIANLSRAIVRTVGSISGKAAQQISRSSGTSPIGDSATTGALCPDDKGGTVRKLRFPATFNTFLSAFLLAGIAASSASLHAGEQDNWYLADEWSVSSSSGVAYEVNATTGKARIYVCSYDPGKLSVYETNGTLVREISGFDRLRGVAVDGNGTIFLTQAW
ncbi:uncharacterized protein METZ01_LOCUS440571, partial [marine metagenome]